MSMRAILAEAEAATARCANCGGPAHEATGWVLQKKPLVMLCGRCAKDFAAWYKHRQGMMSSLSRNQRGLQKAGVKDLETFSQSAEKSIKGD